MRKPSLWTGVLGAAIALTMVAGPAFAVEETKIGVTSASNLTTTGFPPVSPEHLLGIGVEVVGDERVITTKDGRAQLLFLDHSALTIGPNSNLVLDKFVYDPDAGVGELAFSATKGLFRLVGGRISKKTPVTIKTSAGTIGIRGGIAIVSIEEGGPVEATFLFGKEMTVESEGRVVTATRPGSLVTFSLGNILDPVLLSAERLGRIIEQLEQPPGKPTDSAVLVFQQEVKDAVLALAEPAAGPGPAVPSFTQQIELIRVIEDIQDTTTIVTDESGENQGSGGSAPTDLQVSAASFDENAAFAATLSATDPDSTVFTFALTNDPTGGALQVAGDQLSLVAPLDFEALPAGFTDQGDGTATVTLGLSANDGVNTFAKDLTFTVTNVNEPPTSQSLTNDTVPENLLAPDGLIGVLSTVDPDAGDTATFTIVNDPDGKFTIVGNELQLAASLDFEAMTSHDVTVRVTDSDGLTFDVPFTITVTDVNEPPTSQSLTNDTAPENLIAPDGVIGVLSADDPDAGDTVTFTIVNDPDKKFQIGGAAGDELQLAAPLDFEAMTSHNVTLRATDSDGLTFDMPFTITVTNVPDTLFDSTFAGRFKTDATVNLNLGLGTEDGDPAFDIPFSNASIVDGFLTAPDIGLLLPTSGTPIDVEPGFTGFSFDGTGTSSPFGRLAGEGFISDDGAFIVYETIEIDNAPVFRDLIFAGIPATSFPTSGITAYILEPDFVLESNVPFVRGFSGGDLFVADEPLFLIDFGKGVFGGALIAIDGDGQSGNQTSAASVFGGSFNGTPTDLLGLMRGTTRVSSGEQPHFFDSDIELSRDGDGNAFFGADNPDYFVFQSDGGAVDVFEGTTTTYFPNVVAHVDPTETFDAPTSRTLSGFSGGAFQRIDSGGSLLSTKLFINTTADPSDTQILIDATTGTLTAVFDVQRLPPGGLVDVDDNRLVAFFGGAGRSAIFDDEDFGAIESSSISTTFEGAPVDALLYMVTSEAFESNNFPGATSECVCQFLEWGFWGGEIRFTGGESVRIHLANWIAGDNIASGIDLPTVGTAVYSGHLIGTVLNAGAVYQAMGGFNMNFDFAAPKASTINVTGFDAVDYNANVVNLTNGIYQATGADASALSRTIEFEGAFFGGGGDPVAETGGNFNIGGSSYSAAGIFAGAK